MIKNYFKIAWRNLIKNKAHSSINIVGLSVGMAVAMIIGLWIWDELSYDKDNPNYEKIAQVMQHNTINGEMEHGLPCPSLWEKNCVNPMAVISNMYSCLPGPKPFFSRPNKKITKDGIFSNRWHPTCST